MDIEHSVPVTLTEEPERTSERKSSRRRAIDNKPCVLSLSYGKDSLACIGAIAALGWRLDRVLHCELWATDTIPADLPPMVEFKAKADAIIRRMTGITVERVRARKTYEQQFYTKYSKVGGQRYGEIYGWPMVVRRRNSGAWCNSKLKVSALDKATRNCIQYIGIAADEPARFHNLSDTKKSPLAEAGWTEADCRRWCEEHDLLSPIYTSVTRGGCWFCHNQGLQQLRLLRRNYPDYWKLMLKWDADSRRTFHADGHSVRDYERRFAAEDAGLLATGQPFRWDMLDNPLIMRQETLFHGGERTREQDEN